MRKILSAALVLMAIHSFGQTSYPTTVNVSTLPNVSGHSHLLPVQGLGKEPNAEEFTEQNQQVINEDRLIPENAIVRSNLQRGALLNRELGEPVSNGNIFPFATYPGGADDNTT